MKIRRSACWIVLSLFTTFFLAACGGGEVEAFRRLPRLPVLQRRQRRRKPPLGSTTPYQRQREPERADCHRMVRVWRRFVVVKPYTNRQPGDRIREGTLIDQCDTYRTEDRNDLLLPCRGFQFGRDGERDDRKFRHVVDPSDGHRDNFRSRDRQCRFVGSVNPNGLATTAWFEYGLDSLLSNPTRTDNQAIGAGKVPFRSMRRLHPSTQLRSIIGGQRLPTRQGRRKGRSNPSQLPRFPRPL